MAIEFQSQAPAPPQAALLQSLLAGLGAAGGISAQERMLFTERMALLLETGMALHTALDNIGQQTPNPVLARTIAAILEQVLGGKPLSYALSRHPEVFPGAYVNLIRAAEAGGFVAQVLAQILEMEEKQEKLRATLTGALAYPAFLALFSASVVLFVLMVVFPRFAGLFESIRDRLPLSTLVFMTVSDVLRQYWLPIAAGAATLAVLLARWLRDGAGKATIDRFKLRLPLLRELFVQVYMIRIMRVMSASLGNGVSVLDTLQASRETVDNRSFREFLLRVEERVTQGGGIAAAFREEPFIPLLVRQMLSTGEETGKLALVMGRVADFYERELARKIAMVSRMIEPLMLLIMGVVVGLIMISLILPIFQLSRAVH